MGVPVGDADGTSDVGSPQAIKMDARASVENSIRLEVIKSPAWNGIQRYFSIPHNESMRQRALQRSPFGLSPQRAEGTRRLYSPCRICLSTPEFLKQVRRCRRSLPDHSSVQTALICLKLYRTRQGVRDCCELRPVARCSDRAVSAETRDDSGTVLCRVR